MSDKISSIRLLGSNEVTVFRDAGMHGRSARFIGDVEDLKREGWNDQISSIDVGPRRYAGPWRSDSVPTWGREQMPQEGACFYEDKDFRGRYFCAPRGASFTHVPEGLNNRISSIRVFEGEVRIFQDQSSTESRPKFAAMSRTSKGNGATRFRRSGCSNSVRAGRAAARGAAAPQCRAHRRPTRAR